MKMKIETELEYYFFSTWLNFQNFIIIYTYKSQMFEISDEKFDTEPLNDVKFAM